MEEKKAQELFKKYVDGNCTDEEQLRLESWYLMHSRETGPADLSTEDRITDKHLILAALNEAMTPAKPVIRWPKYIGMAAASIVLILIGINIYNSYTVKENALQQKDLFAATDVTPGGNKAILKLANGQTIKLNNDKNGIIIKAGALAYSDGTAIETKGIPQNTAQQNVITTPAGGQYQVILQDGTKVWLNAESSLSYPNRFSDKERIVKVTGEAYFEVAKVTMKEQGLRSKEQGLRLPFIVVTDKQKIEVLGTHFNVMAYPNESVVKTTLLEGSVKVTGKSISRYLNPGQQSQLTDRNIEITNQVDLEEVISWKNGYFKFNEDIKSIMNKIARWYDVEVIYKPGVDLNQTFSGEVSKSRNVSALLKVMELTGNVNFKIEGRRIIVMP